MKYRHELIGIISTERNGGSKLEGKQVMEIVTAAQEIERKRIASDIHDSVNSILSVIKAKIELSRFELSPLLIKKLSDESITLLREAKESLRRIIQNLVPVDFESTGLIASTKGLCDRVKRNGINISFENVGFIENMESEKGLQVYRVIQEIISNYVIHSKGTVLSIQMIGGPVMIIIVVDNGKPFEFNRTEQNSGVGMHNIQNRLSFLKAAVRSKSGPPNITEIFIPISSPEPVG